MMNAYEILADRKLAKQVNSEIGYDSLFAGEESVEHTLEKQSEDFDNEEPDWPGDDEENDYDLEDNSGDTDHPSNPTAAPSAVSAPSAASAPADASPSSGGGGAPSTSSPLSPIAAAAAGAGLGAAVAPKKPAVPSAAHMPIAHAPIAKTKPAPKPVVKAVAHFSPAPSAKAVASIAKPLTHQPFAALKTGPVLAHAHVTIPPKVAPKPAPKPPAKKPAPHKAVMHRSAATSKHHGEESGFAPSEPSFAGVSLGPIGSIVFSGDVTEYLDSTNKQVATVDADITSKIELLPADYMGSWNVFKSDWAEFYKRESNTGHTFGAAAVMDQIDGYVERLKAYQKKMGELGVPDNVPGVTTNPDSIYQPKGAGMSDLKKFGLGAAGAVGLIAIMKVMK